MSKEKDLLAEIEHEEAVIAQATERLNVLRVEFYALRCEARRNKKPTAAQIDVLARLAAGVELTRYVHGGKYCWPDGEAPFPSAVEILIDRGLVVTRTTHIRITNRGRAVLAKHQKGGTQ